MARSWVRDYAPALRVFDRELPPAGGSPSCSAAAARSARCRSPPTAGTSSSRPRWDARSCCSTTWSGPTAPASPGWTTRREPRRRSRLAADLESGEWDRRFGSYARAEFDGGLRLVWRGPALSSPGRLTLGRRRSSRSACVHVLQTTTAVDHGGRRGGDAAADALSRSRAHRGPGSLERRTGRSDRGRGRAPWPAPTGGIVGALGAAEQGVPHAAEAMALGAGGLGGGVQGRPARAFRGEREVAQPQPQRQVADPVPAQRAVGAGEVEVDDRLALAVAPSVVLAPGGGIAVARHLAASAGTYPSRALVPKLRFLRLDCSSASKIRFAPGISSGDGDSWTQRHRPRGRSAPASGSGGRAPRSSRRTRGSPRPWGGSRRAAGTWSQPLLKGLVGEGVIDVDAEQRHALFSRAAAEPPGRRRAGRCRPG